MLDIGLGVQTGCEDVDIDELGHERSENIIQRDRVVGTAVVV